MPYLLNLIYLCALLLLSPWLIYQVLTSGKHRRGFWTKLTGRVPCRDSAGAKRQAVVWFHGVSVGEIHLLRQVVAGYRRRFPDHRCLISTTTDTGHDEAVKAFPDLQVIYWPFDFTWAVKTALGRIRPDLVVLAEGEIWPNFVRSAHSRGVKVAVINGRLSPKSANRHRKLTWLAHKTFSRLSLCAAQSDEFAAAYRALGATHVVTTGNVKYDGTQGDRQNSRTQSLRLLLGIGDDELVWVAGSTQNPEEEIVLGIYERTIPRHPNLRLILVPRQKDRFDPVADLLKRSGHPFVRRSTIDHPSSPSPLHPIILVDSFGELGALWGLADIAFVGGSLDGHRGGQNMIEPSAYGAAVVFGPHTWNFKDTVTRLLGSGAAIQVPDAAGLEMTVLELVANAPRRLSLGEAAQTLVAQEQGATQRTLDVLEELLLASRRVHPGSTNGQWHLPSLHGGDKRRRSLDSAQEL